MTRRYALLALLGLIVAGRALGDSPLELFQAGKQAFQEKLYSVAVRSFSELIQDYPDDPRADDAEYLQGVALFYLGQFHDSIRLLERYGRKYPSSSYNRRVAYWLGLALYRDGQYAAAEEALERQLQYPEERYFHTRSLYTLANAYEKQDRNDQALKSYRELLSLTSDPALVSHALLRIGSIEIAAERYEEALSSFYRLLLDYPESPLARDATYFVGECYFFLGDYDEAAEQFRRLLTHFPGSRYREHAAYRLGYVLDRQGHAQEAIQYLELLLDEAPDSEYRLDAYRILATRYAESEQPEQAWNMYREILAASGDPEERQRIHYNMAQAYVLEGETAKAIRHFQHARSGPDDEIAEDSALRYARLVFAGPNPAAGAREIRAFIRRHSDHPDFEELATRLVDYYEEHGRSTEAAEVLTMLIDGRPSSSRRSKYLYKRATIGMDQGRYGEALIDLQRVVQEDEDSALAVEALYRVGYIYALREEHVRAEEWFSRIAGEDAPPELYERSLYARGLSLLNAGMHAEATGVFERLLQEAPSGQWAGEAHFHMAQTLERQGDLQRAVVEYRGALKRLEDPDLRAEALFQVGWIEYRRESFQAARASFLLLVDTYPEDDRLVEALFRAGLCDAELGDYDQALTHLDSALAGAREELREEALYRKGLVLAEIGRVEEAREVFSRVAEEFPDSVLPATGEYGIAEDAFRDGRYADAQAGYLRVYRRYPDSVRAEPALYWAARSAHAGNGEGEALRHFLEYLRVHPTTDRAYSASRFVAAAIQRRNTPEAAIVYDQVVESGVPPEVLAPAALAHAEGLVEREPDRAIQVLQPVLEHDVREDDRNQAHFLAARSYQISGQFARAVTVYEVVAEAAEGELAAEARFRMAEALMDAGQTDAAAETFVQVHHLHGDSEAFAPRALYRAALLYQSAGEREKQDTVERQLLETYPSSQWAGRLSELPQSAEDGNGGGDESDSVEAEAAQEPPATD
jgi:TolA-binding protein